MARPGIMLYFDILEPIRVLPDEDKGRLLVAMLEYGKEGIVPEFEGMLALAWGFVKPKVDKDKEEYDRTILKRQYATYCRDRKKRGEAEVGFDEWLSMVTNDNRDDHMISHDTKWYPTTTTSTTTNTTTSTSTTTAAAAAANTTTDDEDTATTTDDESKVVKAVGGTLGKGVVFMSDEQVDDLLERMGIETFDYYVDKLSDFIIKNDARVKSHYETILKWWKEDSSLR